jgi:hypothetical protein
MPRAWGHVAHSVAVRLRPCDPALLRFGAASDEVASPGGTLLALTPGELVIARDPDPDRLGDAPACGPDLLHVPRRCLQGADHADTGVRLRAGGVELEVPLTRSLADDLRGLVEHAIGAGAGH